MNLWRNFYYLIIRNRFETAWKEFIGSLSWVTCFSSFSKVCTRRISTGVSISLVYCSYTSVDLCSMGHTHGTYICYRFCLFKNIKLIYLKGPFSNPVNSFIELFLPKTKKTQSKANKLMCCKIKQFISKIAESNL